MTEMAVHPRPLRILAIAEFDPAGVLHGHRAVLRPLGVDYRIAVQDNYRLDLMYDWLAPADPKAWDLLRDFARRADLLQFHPGIGQPWSYQTLEPNFSDGENERLFDIDWKTHCFPGRRVSLFHGSRNTAANAERLATYWREQEHVLWATTLDYVHRMDASYAKPALPDLEPAAKFRTGVDPLIIAHAPTDRGNSHTDVFLDVCNRNGVVCDVLQKLPWAEVIRRKRTCNAGFDHLRGAFSVNTLENCALGLVPLVGIKPAYRDHFLYDRDLFPFHDAYGFERHVRNLIDNPEETRRLQTHAWGWFQTHFDPKKVGLELLKLYQNLLKTA